MTPVTKKMKMFDATLVKPDGIGIKNADLTLTLKLGFKQINPEGGKDEGTYYDYGDAKETARKIVKWTDAAWTEWKNNFVASAQKFWTGKFWLENNFDLYGVESVQVPYVAGFYIPNINCKFKLIGSDAGAGGQHHTIEVVRLAKTETFFGSHSRLYDSLDTKEVVKGRDSKGNKILQKAHVHEVGHLLGLPHVDVGKKHCPTSGNTNAAPCYGVSDEDKKAVMGAGMQLRPANADPWRKAMIAISTKGSVTGTDWKASLTELKPVLKASKAMSPLKMKSAVGS